MIKVKIDDDKITGAKLKRDYGIEYGVLDTLVHYGILEKSDPDKIVAYCTFSLKEVRAGIVILGKLFEDQQTFIPENYKTLLRTQGGWEKFFARVFFITRFLKPEAGAKVMFKAMEDVFQFLLETDTEIMLPGIGKLVAERHEAREIHVPATKEKRMIAARNVWKLRLKASAKTPTEKQENDHGEGREETERGQEEKGTRKEESGKEACEE